MRSVLLLTLCAGAALAADPALALVAPAITRPPASGANGAAVESALDRVRLQDGGELVGRARVRDLAMASALGRVEVGGEITGIARDGVGLALVALADGGRLQGMIDGGAVEFELGVGGQVTVPASDIAELVLADPPTSAAHAGPWLTIGASRVAARWTADRARIRTACGEITVPSERIAALLAPAVDLPLGAIALRDGGRLCGALVELPAAPARLAGSAAIDWSVEAVPAVVDAEAPRLRLASGDIVVGGLGALSLGTAYGERRLPAGGVRRLRPAARDERLFAVELDGGTRLEGRLVAATIAITTAWGAVIDVPTALVRAYE